MVLNMPKINLNFDWKYSSDFLSDYIDQNFDYSDFETVNLPHTNKVLDYNYFDEKEYQFVSCYKKQIFIPEEYNDKVLILTFEGIASYARLYINGDYVAQHFGGYTPFIVDISSYVTFGGSNIFTVECDSTERNDIPPFGNVVDYLTYGGIYREVWLDIRNKEHIKDVFIKTSNVRAKAKLLDVGVELFCNVDNYTANFKILDKDNNVVSAFTYKNGGQKFNICGSVENVQIWNIDCPYLYTLNVQLVCNGEVVDEINQRFGFREVCFKQDGFYLNGIKIKLRGLNRHQSYPYVGYAMPKSAQVKDADILKYELGVNIVRTSHYPQSRHFLDRCDEIGLLVFEEIPGWQHIGDSNWKNIACDNVKEMILRDRNHPSIVMWGVRINESPDCDEFYRVTNQIAHTMDSTRPTGGVRNFKNSHLFEDVYTYNDFIHKGENEALDHPIQVMGIEAPYLVTEHNGHMFPTKRYDNEEKRLEHALRHTRVIDKMMGSDRISGAIGWCAFDYNTHKDFGSGDRICYHGVCDMFRIPKLAAYTYAAQQRREPVLEISSTMDIGEHPAGEIGKIYAFTNCDYIKLYKNNEYINTFYADRKNFPHMAYAPIKIDDFIGDLLEKQEGFSKRDCKTVKDILGAASKHGLNLPLRFKLQMGRIMKWYNLTYEDCTRLFNKYVGSWGGQRVTFRFEGYIGDSLVKTVTRSTVSSTHLEMAADSTLLTEEDTYDVTRIVLRAKDEFGNILPFASDAMNIKVDGPAEIIGPKCIALMGGVYAFWVKSKGHSGTAIISVESQKYGNNSLELDIIKQ